MRAHNNDFKNEIKNYGRQFTDRIWWYGISQVEELTNNEITYINYNVNTTLFKSVMQELTFETTYNGNIGIPIYYDCDLVGVTGSTIQFHKFIQVEKEERKDTKTYRYTCYDNMIKTMKDYETFLNATSDNTFTTDKNYYELDNGVYTRYTGVRTGDPSSLGLYESAFPMTIRDYINAICTRVGITFADASNTFTNYDKNVLQEHYVDVDLNSMGYTYRDVLDDLAEATGSFICINNNGQLCIKGITTTNDTIDENYFKDSNVNIGKHYGAINVVVLSRNDSDNLYYPSTIPQDPVEIKINDNPILEQTNRDTFIQGIYNNVNGLEFYLNDFNSTGVMYYEVGDLYNVSIDGTTYPCLMLNDSITRDGGLTEKIYTEEPTTSVTEYKYASDTDKLEKTSRNAYFLADKANGVASMIVEGIGSNGQVTGASVIASINDDTSQLKLEADKIDINGVVSANGYFQIDNNGQVSITNGEINLNDTGSHTANLTVGNNTGQSTNIWSGAIDFWDGNNTSTLQTGVIQMRANNSDGTTESYLNLSNSQDSQYLEWGKIDKTTFDLIDGFEVYPTTIRYINNGNLITEINSNGATISGDTHLNRLYIDTGLHVRDSNDAPIFEIDTSGNEIQSYKKIAVWDDLYTKNSNNGNVTFKVDAPTGSIETRDSNSNITFSVDGSTGDTTISGNCTINGNLQPSKDITQDFINTFKQDVFNNNTTGGLSVIRKSGTWSSNYFPNYSGGLAFMKDSQGGFLIPHQNANSKELNVGGVSNGVVSWYDKAILEGNIKMNSWTPQLGCVGGETAPTYTTTSVRGYYTKIGKIVFINFYMRGKITALNGTNNYALIKNLPYTPTSNIGFGMQNCTIGTIYSCVNSSTNLNFVIDTTGIRIQQDYGAGATKWVVTSTNYMEFGGSGWYYTD